MDISELTGDQLEKIAERDADWVAYHRPERMADRRPDWMAYYRPEWMTNHRPEWMAAYSPEYMAANRPGRAAETAAVPDHILKILGSKY